MTYYQSPRKRAGSTSSRNEVSWIARPTGITSEGDNPLYYYEMSINGVLVTPALLCWSTSLAGAGAPPFVSRNTCFNPQMRQSPSHFEKSQNGNQSVIEDDANSMPKTYVICQFVSVDTPSSPVQLNPNDVSIRVTRFYRPEVFNAMDAYLFDIHTKAYPQTQTGILHCFWHRILAIFDDTLVAILGLLKMGRTNVEKVESFVVNPLICEVNRGFTVPECVLFFLGFYCFAGMAMSVAQSYGFNL
nr:DNA (cytosine-5)-methyltransferase 1-like [Ipomoea trifida]